MATTPRATASGRTFSASCFTAMLSKKCWDALWRSRSIVFLSIAILCAKARTSRTAGKANQKQRILLPIDLSYGQNTPYGSWRIRISKAAGFTD